jgi:hypothetical protein
VKPVRITSGRHPYEVALLIAAPSVGVIMLLSDPRPRPIATAMPMPVSAVWIALLILSGATGLAGVWWPGRIEMSLSIEAVGVLVLGSATSMYTVAVLAVAGLAGAAAGGFGAAVAGGSWWRLTQIWRDLGKLDDAVKAQTMPQIALLVEQEGSHEQ